MLLGYMAQGSNGETLHLTKPSKPRKQLLDKLYRKSASKVYIDTKSGTTKHVGYIVGRVWWTLYEVHEWSKQA